MHAWTLIAAATAFATVQAGIGFTTYKEIDEGKDNSGEIAYNALPSYSKTLFLYIQIIAGNDHSSIISDFKTLAQNYGENGVAIIPRVRYGDSSGNIMAEPDDVDTIKADAAAWAKIFSDAASTIDIPIIQAGFLGQYGEWHDGPFCQTRGSSDSQTNIDLKTSVVEALQSTGIKIALRYPEDHKQLFNGSKDVTIHDDCLYDEGYDGTDGYTFPPTDHDSWVSYAIQVAAGNGFGGEGCANVDQPAFDWSDTAALCGANGLTDWLSHLGASYMNTGNPSELQALIDDPSQADCVAKIQAVFDAN